MVKVLLIVIGVIIILLTFLILEIGLNPYMRSQLNQQYSMCSNWFVNLFSNEQSRAYCSELSGVLVLISYGWIGYVIGFIFLILGLVLKTKKREYAKEIIRDSAISKSYSSGKVENLDFLSPYQLKRKPIYKEYSISSGNPKDFVRKIIDKLENMGFRGKRGGYVIKEDEIEKGIKEYSENIFGIRKQKTKRRNHNLYEISFWVSLIISIIFTVVFFLILFLESFNPFLVFVILGLWIITLIFNGLSSTKIKEERIWIRVEGKVYPRKNVTSKLIIRIAGDSELSIEDLRKDISNLSNRFKDV